jgi:teichuronic acid biosynthesis glycosyltransferase TuaG
MEDFSKVSIITPVFNCEKYLNETINSVLSQTYSNWEWLLVDDCSSDDSLKIIEKFASSDSRIKVFHLDVNSGSGPARNLAIKNATGKYISFLDSDDIWIPERLEQHIAFMVKGNYAFSHSSYGYLNENGTIMPKIFRVSSKSVDYKGLLKRTEISCLTAIYDQEQLGKYYMPDLRRKQDYGLWLSILKSGVKSVPYPQVLAYYRQREGSATSSKYGLILKHYRFLRQNENLGPWSSMKYTIYWAVGGVFKYYF